MKAESKVIKKG